MYKQWCFLLLAGLLWLSEGLTLRCYAADQTTRANARDTAVKQWSLAECIATALHNHGDVLASEQAAISARAAVTQAKGDYKPTITLQSMPLSFAGASMTNTAVPSTGTSVSITQNIYDSGIREANVKDKMYVAKSSASTLSRQRQTTTNNVTTAYYSAWLAIRQQALQQTTVQDLEGQLEMIHARVKVGDAAQSDAYPVEASLANAKVALYSATNTIHNQLVALQDAMGIEPGGVFDIQEITLPEKMALDPLDNYQVLAVKARPDLQAEQAKILAAKAEEQSAKINLLPHLTLNASYSNSLDHLSLNDWGVSGGLLFTVFDGQKLHAQYQQAQAAVKSAQITVAQLAKDIETQVQQAYLNLTSAEQNLEATAVGLDASDKNYEVQEAEYKEGLSTPQNVLDAQVQVATAKNNQVMAQYNYMTAKAALAYAIGRQGGPDAK